MALRIRSTGRSCRIWQIHKEHFYLAESKEGQKSFVTARGWEDLSCLLKSYEEEGLPCSGVMGQYLQKEAVAEAFERYYELYEKYGMDYDVTGILNGSVIRGSTLYEEKRRWQCRLRSTSG